ncbi:MAG: phosphate ABC transporter permease subunit PstC [Alphaproteobacteria bacterium]
MLALSALIILGLAVGFFLLARGKAIAASGGVFANLHSRPSYHGTYSLLWVGIAGFTLLLVLTVGWNAYLGTHFMAEIAKAVPDARPIEVNLILADSVAIAAGKVSSQVDSLREEMAGRFAAADTLRIWVTVAVSLGGAVLAGLLTLRQISADWRARNRSERIIRGFLWVSATIAVLTTVGIVLSLIFETFNFFASIGWRVDKFLFGTRWSPLSGVQDGMMDMDKVGAVPLFTGTLMITGIAMLVAVPIGLFAAIYLSEFASGKVRAWAKPMLEILAGIPTVVYGFFAAITVAPFIRNSGEALGLSVASESALAAGIVMGIMIIPFISSLSDDVINAVPQSLRDGSYGLGATKAETIKQVVLPAALPGIVSSVLLGVSRAIGETMIVVMAAGQGANLTANPLEAVTTVTVQIVMLITGDTEASTAAGPAFTLAFTLFCITLALNIFALRFVRKYREMYD